MVYQIIEIHEGSFNLKTKKYGIELLIDEVNAAIKSGWRPIGGIVFNQGSCYQAMIKEDEK